MLNNKERIYFSPILIVALFCLLALPPQPVNGERITVNRQISEGDYSEIQNAINNADYGDTVYVSPGTYIESIDMKDGIALAGAGKSKTKIKYGKETVIEVIGNRDVQISNLTIEYAGTDGNATIWIDDSSKNITLEGNIVTGAVYSGLEMGGNSSGILVKRNVFRDNKQNGIFVNDSGRGTIRKNEIYGNGHGGLAIKEGSDPLVIGNSIHDNRQSGIHIYKRGRGTIENNEIYGNGNDGIAIEEKSAPIVTSNIIRQNDETGIDVSESGKGTIKKNEIYENGWQGLAIKDESTPLVVINTINNNKRSGIYLEKIGKGKIKKNEIYGNGFSGLSLKEGSDPLVIGNSIHDNRQSGIHIYKRGRGTIENNEIYGNSYHGLEIKEKSIPKIYNNTVVSNEQNGIWVKSRAEPEIKNNILVKNGGDGLDITDKNVSDGKPTLSHNNVWGNEGNYQGIEPPPTSIAKNPKFVDLSRKNFHLEPGSPCINAGEGGKDLGAHQYKVSKFSRVRVFTVNVSGETLDAKIYIADQLQGETGSNGKYSLSDVSSGTYKIRAEKTGYTPNSATVNLSPGEEENLTLTLERENKPPIASFAYNPESPKTEQSISFDSTSTDPDGKITRTSWTFGDGKGASAETINHIYTEPGSYKVKLKVTDNQEATDTAQKEVKVKNRKPRAAFKLTPEEPEEEQRITFEASSSNDPDGTIKDYSWDLDGDGNWDHTGKRTTRKYGTSGSYTVKLTVTDNHGASATAIKQIDVSKSEEKVKIDEKYALVIGISKYKHDAIADLKYPKQDAQDFYRFLVDDNYEKFPKDNVTLLTNEQATTRTIEREMNHLVTEVDEKDLVIIYYSGHGAPGPDYNNDEEDRYDEYYVTYDTNTSSGAKLYSTGISDDQFGNWLTSMDSKQVAIFLDSCYSGGATKASKGTRIPGQKAVPKNEVFNDFSFDNRLLFAASSENQPSWESPELNQGVFTHFLLKGLKGEADNNEDGKIVADELYHYLKPHVKNYVEKHFTASQTPLMKGSISAPLTEKKEKLEGRVKYVKGADKDKANKEEYVVIDLGSKDGVKAGDRFKVIYTVKGVAIEELHTEIKITDVVGSHLAVGRIVESGLTVEKGYRIRKK